LWEEIWEESLRKDETQACEYILIFTYSRYFDRRWWISSNTRFTHALFSL
jgi:hypothetical protein